MSASITARAAGLRAKFGLLVLGSLAGVMAAGAASAAGLDSDVPSVVVKYSERSLATDDGVYTLYRRITSAAKRVCPDASTKDLSRLTQVEQCRDQAVARAIRQIDNSRLPRCTLPIRRTAERVSNLSGQPQDRAIRCDAPP